MTFTNALTGSLFVYTLSIRMLLCYPATVHSFSDGSPEITGPKIIALTHSTKEKHYTISCQVKPGLLNDETMVYWLANDSFIDAAFTDGRVKTNDTRIHKSDGWYIRSDLVFYEHRQEDRLIKFTCIALNPAGKDISSTKERYKHKK